MSADGHERVVVEFGERSGVTLAIAVHSTALGPALGGARMWHYERTADAIEDARRLAASMTLKAAAAGLDLGGGKGVIATPEGTPPASEVRRAILLDFGDLVESLEGDYVTAEDVGTSSADMSVIAERTAHVVGLDEDRGGSGDPSPVTARGVLAAMRACATHRYGTRELRGLRVGVVGLGHVGGALARLLADAGAELFVSDIDPERRRIGEALGASWVHPAAAIGVECDVLAPCALGGLIGENDVSELRAAIVCVAANNVLTSDAVAAELDRRGVLYAPDFIANAGGLISVYGELHRLPHERAVALADGIEAVMGRTLEVSDHRRITPLAAARETAMRRLDPRVPAAA